MQMGQQSTEMSDTYSKAINDLQSTQTPQGLINGVYVDGDLVNCIAYATGRDVSVDRVDDTVINGIFGGCGDGFEVGLYKSYLAVATEGQLLVQKSDINEKESLKWEHIRSMNVEISGSKANHNFATDVDISRKLNGKVEDEEEKELVAWADEELDSGVVHGEDARLSHSASNRNGRGAKDNGWSADEMFRRNNEMGIQSTFDGSENLYTTAQIVGTDADRRRAEAMAREIENNVESKKNAELENEDEEKNITERKFVKSNDVRSFQKDVSTKKHTIIRTSKLNGLPQQPLRNNKLNDVPQQQQPLRNNKEQFQPQQQIPRNSKSNETFQQVSRNKSQPNDQQPTRNSKSNENFQQIQRNFKESAQNTARNNRETYRYGNEKANNETNQPRNVDKVETPQQTPKNGKTNEVSQQVLPKIEATVETDVSESKEGEEKLDSKGQKFSFNVNAEAFVPNYSKASSEKSDHSGGGNRHIMYQMPAGMYPNPYQMHLVSQPMVVCYPPQMPGMNPAMYAAAAHQQQYMMQNHHMIQHQPMIGQGAPGQQMPPQGHMPPSNYQPQPHPQQQPPLPNVQGQQQHIPITYQSQRMGNEGGYMMSNHMMAGPPPGLMNTQTGQIVPQQPQHGGPGVVPTNIPQQGAPVEQVQTPGNGPPPCQQQISRQHHQRMNSNNDYQFYGNQQQ
uniref:LsmAD domain-containing protein n=1 Tax=Rhabditophanes sp. KR3021 TaxID=114890 RepID=A0AC35TML3_9BILA